MEIDYQSLVNQYYQNLQDNLRHFKGGPGFLESWALDEDHNRGLLEILDLSRSENLAELRIRLPEDLARTIRLDFLQAETANFGTLTLKEGCLIFRASPGPAYREALHARSSKLAFKGLIPASKEKFLAAGEGKGQLCLHLSPEGLVLTARHEGWPEPSRALLDYFCEILEGRPLQEGAEHGVIRLERALRDIRVSPAVNGLLTPENADACFALPLRLIRSIWASYAGASPGQRNTWRDQPPSLWLALTDDARLAEARRQVALGTAALELAPAEVLALRGLTRLTLSPLAKADKSKFGAGLIRLERWLRMHTGVPFELQMESSEDRNRREARTDRISGVVEPGAPSSPGLG